jgi:MraZ protein
VALYPIDEWRRMEERLRSRSFHDPIHRRFLRLMALDLNEETLDAQGRLSIPPRLLAHAQLKREAMVNGVMDHIEIWDPDLFDQYVEPSEL